jgi:hypothetical protein
MGARFTFVITYDAGVMKSVGRKSLVRVLFVEDSWWSVLAIMGVISGVSLLLWGDKDFVSGFFTGLVVAIVAAFAFVLLWFDYSVKAQVVELRLMKEPRATVSLFDDSFEMTSELGSWRFPWDTIHQIRKFDQAWILINAHHPFMTLPLAGIPADALQFLESKIQPRRL